MVHSRPGPPVSVCNAILCYSILRGTPVVIGLRAGTKATLTIQDILTLWNRLPGEWIPARAKCRYSRHHWYAPILVQRITRLSMNGALDQYFRSVLRVGYLITRL